MKKPKIMIVDDAVYMRAVLKYLLEENGFVVSGLATNGEEAVMLYKSLFDMGETPDLVLMDINMKKMNGIEALKRIKEQDQNANVVMCSAAKSKDKLVEAIQSGAVYFIEKPFKDEEVLKTVHEALRRRF